MAVLSARDLKRRYDERKILDGVALSIEEGERVGLVGDNGAGKSTLGRILAGAEAPDEGILARARQARVDYLPQEPELPADRTILEVVGASLKAWTAAMARYEKATEALGTTTDAAELDRLVTEQMAAADAIEHEGGWERLHEAESIIGHLGLTDSSRVIGTLSGGERRRVALAQILVDAPELAILDEPTNHLDIPTIEWLEEYLCQTFKGALLLITHDRAVLENLTTRTLEIHDGQVRSYDGGYIAYLEARAERTAHAERSERNRQNFLRRELEWLRRSPQARSTKQKARIDRVEAVRDQDGPARKRTISMQTGTSRLGRTVLTLQDLRLERGGNVLIEKLTMALGKGERVGIIGPNGAGKTSLFLHLLGELASSHGEKTIGINTKIGHLDQERSGLNPDLTIFAMLAEDRQQVNVGGESLSIAVWLERFLFDRREQRARISTLSGGERARVCLARLLAEESNLLLFDEPTNDLDTSTLAALEEMLITYPGSALIISHDRWFLDRVATSILAFDGDGHVELTAGNYSDWKERGGAPVAPAESVKARPAPAVTKPIAAKARAKKLSFQEERELEGLLASVESAEADVTAVEAVLADPETYRSRGDEVAILQKERARHQAEVERKMARWEELEGRKAAS
ncbi:MAG: ABC-F family ATP-binding cassette domain-containing protein [Deltaproteobacteria bacterium]